MAVQIRGRGWFRVASGISRAPDRTACNGQYHWSHGERLSLKGAGWSLGAREGSLGSGLELEKFI